jgi:O-antigen/teichoic acid export membrane protein
MMSSQQSVVGRSTAVGSTWTVGARLISRAMDLCTMVVLAHVLRPRDFGLVAIAMTVIYIVEAALEMPISQALVRLKEPDAAHYDTAFTLGLLRGLALSLILCLCGKPFSHFYADGRLFPLVCVLSLAPASRGLVSPALADFSRRFDFTPDFIMEFVGKLLAFGTAIGLALLTHSYWAIAAGTVISPLIATAVSYIVAPYRPRLSLKEMSSFSGFLGWITAAQVISAINWQADRLLLGKLTSRTEMGLFTAANDTANIPLMAFLGPVMRPLLSAFSVTREKNERLVNSYQISATAILTLGLPLLVGESLLAQPGTRLLLGPNWGGSANLLRWLALSIVPTLFASPMGPLVMAFGRTQIFLKRNLFELCVKLPLVVVGAIKFGFLGIIVARGISETASVLYCMYVVRRLTGLPIAQQLFHPWRSVVSTTVMAVALWLMDPLLTHLAGASLAGGVLFVILTGAAVYLISLFSLWYASDCPAGLESMVAHKCSSLLKHQHAATEAA